MIRNYLKIAARNYSRNYIYVIVNILGLTFGIACSIIAYFNWEFHNDFDGIHSNRDKIFKVNTVRNFENQSQNYGITPFPLADQLGNISNITKTARYSIHNEVVKLDDKVIRQEIAYVDPEFLDIFTFDMVAGTKGALDGIYQAYVTQATAETYYGNTDPLGKPLKLRTAEGREIELNISGIIPDHPLNSSFKFNLLLNMDSYIQIYGLNREEWGYFSHATFLLLDHRASSSGVEKLLQPYINPLNEAREDWIAEKYYLVPLDNMASEARYIRGNYLGFNNPEGAIMIPMIMAAILLLVACVNFMNTSLALSENRLKEIGVRKSVGARKGQLVVQLLTENILLILIALVFGILLAEYLIPIYSQLGPWIDLKITYLNNFPFFGFLVTLLLLTAVFSGLYPALYISKFNVTNIFNGRYKLKGSGRISKILVVLQLSFSLIALIQGIVYVQNTWLQESFDLGYKKYGIITIPLTKDSQFQSFSDEIQSHTGVLDIGGTNHHVGYNLTSGIAEINGQKNEIRVFEVGANYAPAMEMELAEGRNFHDDSEQEIEESIIVNQQFIKDFHIVDPLDRRVLLNEKPYHVIGIVEDFYPYGLWKNETNHSMILKLVPKNDFQFVVVNVDSNKTKEMDSFLESKWKQMFPNSPYESELENIHVARSELLSANLAAMNIFLAAIALFLSAVGLFTIISLTISKRTKEIGVRKILGASLFQIIGLINKGFIWIILLSIGLGVIMGAYLTEMFLDLMYAIHSHVGITSIGITTILVITIVTLTSGFKIVGAANGNPVDALKYE